MSNGLFAADGLDIPALIHEHLSPRLLDAVLIKPGAAGERDPDHPTRAPVPGAPTEHKARGFTEDFSVRSIDGKNVIVGDRKVTLIANSIEGGVEPDAGKDRVRIEGRTYAVHRIIERDPAGATFLLHVRTPAKQET